MTDSVRHEAQNGDVADPVERNDADIEGQERTGSNGEGYFTRRGFRSSLSLPQKRVLLVLAFITILGSCAVATLTLGSSSYEKGTTTWIAKVRSLRKPFTSTYYEFTYEPSNEHTYEPTDESTDEPTTPYPTQTPSVAPTHTPTTSPSLFPTAAPTIPELGCRRDRFDNEGNRQKNNKLFMGQFVCSDDDDQTYWFGLDPGTADLIWYNSTSGKTLTVYRNEWHRSYLKEKEERRALASKNCSHFIAAAEDDAFEEQDGSFFDEGSTTVTRGSETTDNCTTLEEEEEEEETFLDYYFDLSKKGTFRIHRIQRTFEYEIIDSEMQWRLPSKYNISTVEKDCLFDHDCPYLHLHQDGVMVLAWKDYDESKDGWMEKNFKTSYKFSSD